MIIRNATLLAVAVVSAASLGGCADREGTAGVEAAGDEAPALDAGAAQAALAMIAQDLNAPLAEVQALLASAAEDGDIRAHELTLYTPEGSLPLDWWVWNKGLVRLAEEPGYGPYIGLSEKGSRFLGLDAAAWLKPSLVGSPRMECRSAGSATSAACSAEVAYATAVGPGIDLGAIDLPQANAHLEAVFAPGQGWSVSRLSTDGPTPSAMVRAALFGTADDRTAARAQYSTSLTAALERQAAASRSADAPAPAGPAYAAPAATVAPPSTASKPAAPAAAARTIVNASYSRQPTNEELTTVFPAQALRDGISGRSTMSCIVLVSGRLDGCAATAETPAGYRFGQAAVAASRFFRMNPRTEDGTPVASRVSLSIIWTP
ncbi:energy transducer TonB [Brevundimonas sp.]|uniref:energy transducer TonB n=1 Tax=Brevundimonas sp. TaxID=1871086 RepID=UPI002D429A28|nr:energy transducer TonB [Brevundimonas sp.]HYD28623.1 energy transducer TonB [Brevundimonas sp.]